MLLKSELPRFNSFLIFLTFFAKIGKFFIFHSFIFHSPSASRSSLRDFTTYRRFAPILHFSFVHYSFQNGRFAPILHFSFINFSFPKDRRFATIIHFSFINYSFAIGVSVIPTAFSGFVDFLFYTGFHPCLHKGHRWRDLADWILLLAGYSRTRLHLCRTCGAD